MAVKRSLWMFGLEADEPSYEARVAAAARLSERLGVELQAPRIPPVETLQLREHRITPPEALAGFCRQDVRDRAYHSYGYDRVDHGVWGNYPNPPDVVAHPRSDEELEAILEWADNGGFCVIPFGGGSSVVGGVTPPDDLGPVVTVSLDAMDRVLEVDATSRAARIQAGVFGPHLEEQLRPLGFTLRHFPQSFAGSTLGGWIATRAGGHYATNHTHIDDFVESLRMLTPSGWLETCRLPASGAGPDPNRLAIGSEGVLGIISEAWMRIQLRPRFRASAAVTFPTWDGGWEATRRIAQAKLWPANLRLLDPDLARSSAGTGSGAALLIIGFESGELSQRSNIADALSIARDAGGVVDDAEVRVEDGSERPTGRGGAIGAWREAFIPGESGGGLGGLAGLGVVAGTFETAVTWESWPELDYRVRSATHEALQVTCGGGSLNCRFTHVYPDGPAPYYTYVGAMPQGMKAAEAHGAVKQAASDAILACGGTITHHHAVGRLHRPWYDQERPDLFARVLRAAKSTLDPGGILNPGVLIDP